MQRDSGKDRTDPTGDPWSEQPTQEREQRFHSAADNFPHVYVVYDPDLRVVFINQAGVARSGLARERILGRRDDEIFPPSVTGGYLPQLRHCLETRATQTFESTQLLPTGSTTMLVSYIPVLDRTGGLRQIIAVTFDITERKRAEEQLRRNESRLAAAIGVAQLGIWEFDVQTGLSRLDARSREILGLPGEEPLPLADFLALVHPDDRSRVAEQVRLALAPLGAGLYDTEYRVVRRDGTQTWVAARGHALGVGQGPGGGPAQFVGTLMDIAERKRAELERDRFFNLSLDMLGIASTRDGHWKRVNPAFVRVLGWCEAELLAMPFIDLVHPDDDPASRQATLELLAGKPLHGFRNRVRCQDGSYRWIAWNTVPYPAEELIYCAGRDVTGPKLAEEALRTREAEARARADELAALMDVVPAITFLALDPQCRRMESNRAARQLLRLPEGANASMSAGAGERTRRFRPVKDGHELPPEGLPVQLAAATGQEVRNAELSLLLEDGTLYNIIGNAVPLFDAAGRPRGAVGAFIDITERKQAEAKLKESESFYRQTLESIPGLVFTTRPDGYCDFMSQQWVRFTGVPTSELLGDGWSLLLPPEDRLRALSDWRAAVEGRAPYDLEYRIRRRDGRYEWFKIRGRPIRDAAGRVVRWFGAAVNIDALVKAQADLRESKEELERFTRTLEDRVRERTVEVEHRADQLRQLHAELARTEQKERRQLAATLHDGLQQLLVAAKMRVGLARDRAGEAAHPVLAEVDDLLDQSIEASRSLTVELSPPVLHERGLVAALQWLARRMLDKQKLTVKVLAAENVEPPTEDLRLLLFQAARELLFNVAKHAQAEEAVVSLRREEACLRLDVVDSGKGFDPREITGPDPQSASFGLFDVQQRLAWLGGTLEIESAPGKGTQVRLRVPMTGPQPEVAAAAAATNPASAVRIRRRRAASVAAAGRRQRILLADDHEVVRDGLVSLLAGCPDLEVVAQASTGLEAVELAREHQPDIVVMDMSMPELDGIEATRRIVADLPRTRIIGLSMHESADFADAMREAGAVGYLRKGGPIDDLIALIRAGADPRA